MNFTKLFRISFLILKTKNPTKLSGFFTRRGGQIRTDDLHIPNVARYRATLHPEVFLKKIEDANIHIFLYPQKIDINLLNYV